MEDCEGIRFFSFFPHSPGNKFSFRASCVYQDRRFKFIPVAPVRHAPLVARIVARLSSEVQYIETSGARGLEYRCPRSCGFSSARGTRYFLAARIFLGPSSAATPFSHFRSPAALLFRARNFHFGHSRRFPTKKLFRNLEFDYIDMRGQ